jgi:hypothetical protein
MVNDGCGLQRNIAQQGQDNGDGEKETLHTDTSKKVLMNSLLHTARLAIRE